MSIRWLKLTVAYDGRAYAGWQIQPDQPTVQGTLEGAIREVTQQTVRISAAGRTDAGVHALGQVVGLAIATRLSNHELHRALNAVLPEDICVVALDDAPEGFHATHRAIAKQYRYCIHNSRTRPLFNRHYAWHYPQPLDVPAMHTAGQALVGRHDFSSFETAGSERADSIRTIHELTVSCGAHVTEPLRLMICPGEDSHSAVSEKLPYVNESFRGSLMKESEKDAEDRVERVTIEVSGDGFLYNMVRTIVGTLVEVGSGARGIEWPAEVLGACDRRLAGQTAPPQGLFLVRVDYR
jgi:tRNA pseudouridine38-40 synthase